MAAAHAPPSGQRARVVSEHRGIYTLALADDGATRLARLPGRLRRSGMAPVVGDWVDIDSTERAHAEFATIVGLGARSSLFQRRRSDGRVQVIAANLDLAVIVAAANRPDAVARAQAYLAVAEASALPCLVVFSKCDLAPLPPWPQPDGPEVIAVSSATARGKEPLLAHLVGKTAILLGDSGAGKSSLLNWLLGAEQHRIGALSTRGEGTHTTTERVLVSMPYGGALIDSPGWRLVSARLGATT